MTLWIIFAALTALALLAVFWPVLRGRGGSATRSAHDASVYQDQLKEIETDLERGLISERDAEAARLEVSRRLLAVADKAEGGEASDEPATNPLATWALAAGLLAVPLVSLSLYLTTGSPHLPDQPHTARLETPTQNDTIQALVAKVEARLRANPSDGQGWDVIAPVYLKSRRYSDAVDAFARAIRLQGESVSRLAGYGEALVMANNGIVSETARQVYERALSQDPALLKAHFWLAMAKEQDGRFAEAAEAWRAMLAHGSENARWRPVVKERLRVAEAKMRGEDSVKPQAAAPDAKSKTDGEGEPGPTADQVAAASQMSASERAAMINQMVEGLAARLKADGSDLKGWLRLVRAYTVLDKRQEAETALAGARRNFADDDKALSELKALAQSLGL